MQIIRELKRFADRWADGKILDPEDGKVYTLRATPVDGGRKLEMHGYIGLPLLAAPRPGSVSNDDDDPA